MRKMLLLFKGNIKTIIVASGIFLMYILYCFVTADGYDYSMFSSTQNIDRNDAMAIAQQYVLKNLKTPATATFPWSEKEYEFVNKESGRWLVRSYVDAKNSFGSTIRHKWWVEIRHTGGKDWELMNIAIY